MDTILQVDDDRNDVFLLRRRRVNGARREEWPHNIETTL